MAKIILEGLLRMNSMLDQQLASRLAMTRRIAKTLIKCEIPIAATSNILELVINSRGDIFQTIVDKKNNRFYLWHKDS